MNLKTIIGLVTIAAAIVGCVVGWSLAEFDNLRARLALREVEIANARLCWLRALAEY